MLRICISGLTDSGKTTIGEMLAKDLKIMHVTKYITDTYKSFKQNEHKHDGDGKILQTANKEIAKEFDDHVVHLAAHNDCVVTTWIGSWLVKDPTIRIWLHSSFDERVRRCSVERKLSIDEAREYVNKKDRLNEKVFMDLYKIDITDHSDFDARINTDNFTKEEIVSIISMLALLKDKKKFR